MFVIFPPHLCVFVIFFRYVNFFYEAGQQKYTFDCVSDFSYFYPYRLVVEWQVRLIIPLSRSIRKFRAENFDLLSCLYFCAKPILIIWYEETGLPRTAALLSILLKTYISYFKIVVSGRIDMDLFMKHGSKQVWSILIYHPVPHSHII